MVVVAGLHTCQVGMVLKASSARKSLALQRPRQASGAPALQALSRVPEGRLLSAFCSYFKMTRGRYVCICLSSDAIFPFYSPLQSSRSCWTWRKLLFFGLISRLRFSWCFLWERHVSMSWVPSTWSPLGSSCGVEATSSGSPSSPFSGRWAARWPARRWWLCAHLPVSVGRPFFQACSSFPSLTALIP